jgi:hypothetical protein
VAEKPVEQPARTFDEIVSDDGARRLTFDEFMALPLSDRVKLVITARPHFYKDGAEIPRSEALRLT